MFKKWLGLVCNPAGGLVATAIDNSDNQGILKISTIAEDIKDSASGVSDDSVIGRNGIDKRTLFWEYQNAVCIDVEEPAFSQGEANPLTCKAKFIFGHYADPQSTDFSDALA
jgi:hypothetical protein